MAPRQSKVSKSAGPSNRRVGFWFGLLVLVFGVMSVRLFYLQVIKHDYYRAEALADQQKEYVISASRGVINVRDGGEVTPLVLNERLYTLYVDPVYIKDAKASATKVADVVGGDAASFEKMMAKDGSRYKILAKRLSEEQSKKVLSLKLPGVGTQAVNYRAYPQGTLAAQTLGFVNDEGKGTYGLEQALNSQLAGVPGRLKAITDVQGVPLAASPDNVQIAAKPGDDVTLTIELAMQKQLENYLKSGLERAKAVSGSALVIDVNTGAIKAMANLPSYNPAEYFKVEDQNLFNNAAVSSPLEVGSVMKVMTAAAALDMSVIKPDTAFYDPGRWRLNDADITNIEEVGGAGTRNVSQVLDKSINTGATWMLMQMGGKTGEVNKKARESWHKYMTDNYRLGRETGIEQGYEAKGMVPDPNDGYGLELAYANTSFGQAMTATMIQMGAAMSAVVNGGNYYQPTLVDSYQTEKGEPIKVKPKVLRQGVVSNRVSTDIRALMEVVVKNHNPKPAFSDRYSVGGKTGTAQIADPKGGYYKDKYNGTYVGFVGGDRAEYVVAIVVREPKIGGYAGSQAAQPIFWNLAHMLINNFGVEPKSG